MPTPSPGRHVLDVGTLVGVTTGGNPHRWYSPSDVRQVIDAITLEYTKLDPGDASVLRPRSGRRSRRRDSAQYHALISEIKTKYARHARRGVGEHLRAHGARPGAEPHHAPELPHRDQRRVGADGGRQGDDRSRRSPLMRSRCTSTTARTRPRTSSVRSTRRRAANIPITTITETLVPAGATFQAWQVGQLRTLAAALHEATGR